MGGAACALLWGALFAPSAAKALGPNPSVREGVIAGAQSDDPAARSKALVELREGTQSAAALVARLRAARREGVRASSPAAAGARASLGAPSLAAPFPG